MNRTKPTIIVTVDTEEEGLWSRDYRRDGNTVANIQEIPRFQRICQQFFIRPTYLVDTPVAVNAEAIAVLRAISDSDLCEIGAHLHPWCGPPFEEELSRKNSYLHNLPPDLQFRKLEHLTHCIENSFGRRPTSFRAGRYGLDIVGARHLVALGYVVDSSVLPFYDYSAQGGPNYTNAPFVPYRIGGSSLTIPHDEGLLWEIPVSAGFRQPNFRRVARWAKRVQAPWLRKLRLPGICDRLGLIQKIKFSPESSDANRMKRLVDCCIANGSPCMVMLLHSSSLSPGHSPYVSSIAQLEQFYRELAATLDYCRNRLSLPTATLTEYAMQLTEKSYVPIAS